VSLEQSLRELLALDLVLVELLNSGWKAQRQGAITEAQFQAIGELAPHLFSELVPAATLLSTAQRWCCELDHPGPIARPGSAPSGEITESS